VRETFRVVPLPAIHSLEGWNNLPAELSTEGFPFLSVRSLSLTAFRAIDAAVMLWRCNRKHRKGIPGPSPHWQYAGGYSDRCRRSIFPAVHLSTALSEL